MNDSQVSEQVTQMVHFIRQEAEEKANEIGVSAEEEFNIEKLQLVEAEKKKIRLDYERKEKQVEVRKKIEYSTQLNASRLKVLQAQDDLVRAMKAEAEKQLVSVSEDGDAYSQLLKSLIVQGLYRLKEPSVQLRCREQDYGLVEGVLDDAKTEYMAKVQTETSPEVLVDGQTFLPGPPEEGTPVIWSICVKKGPGSAADPSLRPVDRFLIPLYWTFFHYRPEDIVNFGTLLEREAATDKLHGLYSTHSHDFLATAI
ncbi:hypothetical protein AXG93_1660s1330 [Marchantia polymorpha subsp. ruderalis]|uniref:Uncharacterized protein n=1 Tax=Marchantia polymorpha subsp. ruderalis TaxID=1480154 RepID=A0A176VR39_MARPO|nr:hypothetical protein AXG93_1660s1330 [Marchantia polymorpha subsp. ruderalis]